MGFSEQRKEEITAWSLGVVGLLKGVVEVYAIEPTVAAIRMRRDGDGNRSALEVTGLAANKNVIAMPTARIIGATALAEERIAA